MFLTSIEENYESWQVQDDSKDNNKTRHQHPVAESSDKEDEDEGKKDGLHGLTEGKGNEYEN